MVWSSAKLVNRQVYQWVEILNFLLYQYGLVEREMNFYKGATVNFDSPSQTTSNSNQTLGKFQPNIIFWVKTISQVSFKLFLIHMPILYWNSSHYLIIGLDFNLISANVRYFLISATDYIIKGKYIIHCYIAVVLRQIIHYRLKWGVS